MGRVAVVIPCLNEQPTIGKVVDDFRRALPDADIVVYDNMSTDGTAAVAEQHGARVVRVRLRGKGQVVAAMMADVRADVQVMVDGDDTYLADAVGDLLRPILDGHADMTVAARLTEYSGEAFRPLHVAGNKLVCALVNLTCRGRLTDPMSGYRAYTARVAAALDIQAVGFEVETELTMKTLDAGFVIREVPVAYRERPAGSDSKLRTFHDGARILWTLANLFRKIKPRPFYNLLAAGGAVAAAACLLPAAIQLIHQRRVRSVAAAVVGLGLAGLAAAAVAVGRILQARKPRPTPPPPSAERPAPPEAAPPEAEPGPR